MVILGGGLAGLGAAYVFGQAGWTNVTIVDAASRVGGLAGSFEHAGRSYPLGYHHILHKDRTLLFVLDRIGALSRVRWKRIRLLIEAREQLYDLATVTGFASFPLGIRDKLCFVRLMLRAAARDDWSAWEGRTSADLIDRWASPAVRRLIFEPLCRLKFELPCDRVSAAWLGARLSFREGSAPLGFIPETNWTTVLCAGLEEVVRSQGTRVIVEQRVTRVTGSTGRLQEVELANGTRLNADVVICALPTEAYFALVPSDRTAALGRIRFTALLSAVCGAVIPKIPDFYWLSLTSLGHTAGGVFLLNSLNPTISPPGESCINFVTHLQSRNDPRFVAADEELMRRYREDFSRIFRSDLQLRWFHVSRLPMYSPIFVTDYENPPVRSETWGNVFFAGNYRTYPSIASTGTALMSGVQAAEAVLHEQGNAFDISAIIRRFRH